MTAGAYFAETLCLRCGNFEWTHVAPLLHAVIVSLTPFGRSYFPPDSPEAQIPVPDTCDLCAVSCPPPPLYLTGRTLIRGWKTKVQA